MAVVTLVEVLRRSEQGQTRPYLCIGEDEVVYFVKGKSATRRGLVAEWLGAHLAAALLLPRPPFALLDVPDELVRLGAGQLSDLGTGPAFGSARVLAGAFTLDQYDLVLPEVRAAIGAFDWWIRNMDRTLTRHGGNPNLLWQPSGRESGAVVVFDHNLAFDVDFQADAFLETHVFAEDVRRLASNFLRRAEMQERFEEALPAMETALQTVPLEWGFIDEEQTVPVAWQLEEFRTVLTRCRDADFWTLR